MRNTFLDAFHERRKERGGSPPGVTYFLLVQKVGKDTFRGENTDSTSGAEKRALAHSIFPLKTPIFYGDAIKWCSVLPTGAGYADTRSR